jgi:hypothetical protein
VADWNRRRPRLRRSLRSGRKLGMSMIRAFC